MLLSENLPKSSRFFYTDISAISVTFYNSLHGHSLKAERFRRSFRKSQFRAGFSLLGTIAVVLLPLKEKTKRLQCTQTKPLDKEGKIVLNETTQIKYGLHSSYKSQNIILLLMGDGGGPPIKFSTIWSQMVGTAWILDLHNISDHFAF